MTPRRRKSKLPPNLCRWCGARVRWATEEDSGERIPLDVGLTTTGTRYLVMRAGNVDVATRLLQGDERPGRADHRSHCRSSDPEARNRRDLD